MTVIGKEKAEALFKTMAKRLGIDAEIRDGAKFAAAAESAYARGEDGKELFPSPEEKAAKLAFEFCRSNCCTRGGRSMGMFLALVTLEASGLEVDAACEEISECGFAISARRMNYDETLAWICRHAR